MKTLIIVISLINFAVLQSDAKPDRPIVLSRENLTALRESAETQAIKNVLSKKSDCTDCTDVFENANNAKSFIVVEKQANGFGGNFVLLVFAKVPKLYRFWLYPIDKNEFEIREAVVQRKFTNELMSETSRKAYADYWVHL